MSCSAAKRVNASPTRSVGPALVLDTELIGPQFNGQTHMNMIGTTNLIMFDLLMGWASTNIPNPMDRSQCGEDEGD